MACSGIGAAGAESAGRSTALVLVLSEGTGTDAVLVTTLLNKGLAAEVPQSRIS
jgi:hypothetical protein